MKSTTHRRPERGTEAAKRQQAWAALSAAEKIASLDERLGKGIGAARQRKRIAELAVTEHQRLPVSGDDTPAASEPATKKTKAKERRAKEKGTTGAS